MSPSSPNPEEPLSQSGEFDPPVEIAQASVPRELPPPGLPGELPPSSSAPAEAPAAPPVEAEVPLPPPRLPRHGGLLSGLAHFLRLDVYGTFGLGSRARAEMGFAALLLSALFLFDLGAWYLFFKLIFAPAGALAAALLPTTVTFVYERQFLTADTSGSSGWLRILPAFSIRLLIIGVVAVVTAQPVELLIFHGRVQQRIHEESVRSEAVRRQRALIQARQVRSASHRNADLAERLAETPQALRYERSQKALARGMKQQELSRSVADDARRRVAELKPEVKRLEDVVRHAPSRSEQLARARGQLAVAKMKLAQASAEARDAEAQIAEGRAEVAVAQRERDESKKDLDGEQIKLEQRAEDAGKEGALTEERLRNWVAKIQTARPGSTVYEFGNSPGENRAKDGSRGFEFTDEDYDFFLRIETLNDLRYGRAARWPDTSKQIREVLAGEYGLQDLDKDDEDMLARRQQEAKDFTWIWRLVLLAAMVIPLLVIAMKFLMPPEMKAYYNSAFQGAAGNPEAAAFRAAMRRVRREERAEADD